MTRGFPEAERGIFLPLAWTGLRPGEARALEAADYRDGWLTVDKALEGKSVSDAVRGGVPERFLQRFLGHAPVQSTRR